MINKDIALINKHRRPANRLGFAVLLCYLRGPRFVPDKNNVPHCGVVSRIASRLKLQPDLWHEYAAREQTRWEHLAELYRYLKLSPFSRTLQKDCTRHLHSYAMRTDKGFTLAEEMLSWLHNNNVIFPSVDVIERTLAEAVTLADSPASEQVLAVFHQGQLAQSVLSFAAATADGSASWFILLRPDKVSEALLIGINNLFGLFVIFHWRTSNGQFIPESQ